MELNKCLICGGKCEGYAHYECSVLYLDARENRVKKIYEKYGYGLRGQRVLIKNEDLQE